MDELVLLLGDTSVGDAVMICIRRLVWAIVPAGGDQAFCGYGGLSAFCLQP